MTRCNSCFKEYETDDTACPHCGYVQGSPPEELSHLYPGTELAGRYVIGSAVGFGGFGITYRAWDKKLDIVVAVKEYYPSGIVNRVPGTNEVMIYAKKRTREYNYGKDRFLDEARNMAKFSSEPNIINVFEFFEENNTAYIVMEFLDGISLSTYIHTNGGKVDIDQGKEIAHSIGSALCRIHEKGIIHRDVSPDNIFLCFGGGIKLIDFGAARFSQDESKLMTIILKPGFAPPEQYEKINEQGPWTDVYALGATLYYVLTGEKPEESTNRKIKDTLPYPNAIEPSITENFSNCIMKAMAIDLKLRFKDVSEFLAAMDSEKTLIPIEKEKKKKKNKRIIGICAAAAVLGVGIFIGTRSWTKEKDKETLPTVTVEMWYCKSGDAVSDKAEEEAYRAMIADFNSSFENVTINLKGFAPEEYEDALSSAKQLPAVYECPDGLPESAKPLALDSVYDSENAEKCSLLKKAKDCYGELTVLPLGFKAPVVYENTLVSEFEGPAATIDDLTANGKVVSDNNAAEKMYPGSEKYTDSDALAKFSEGKAAFYISDTDSYDAVADALPAHYRLMPVVADDVYTRYGDLWAANDIGKDENKVSLRLLEFMLNNNAQDALHIRNRSGNMPINDEVLDVYTGVYDDFSGFFDNKEDYVFVK